MSFDAAWKRALHDTEIIRARVQALLTFADTRVPYILLSESSVNVGDTVVRRGEVLVDRPALILPPNLPRFEGFEFDPSAAATPQSLVDFLLVRGVNLPSLKYNNQTQSLDLYEGRLALAVNHYKELLTAREDVHTGLLVGPEEYWQFSVLIFICSQVARNADTDIRRLLDEFRKRSDQRPS